MADFTDFMLAADNHNIGNTGTSWLDLNTWEQKIGNLGKLAATSILSGANSFYNTGVAVGNFFGADLTEENTQKFITGLDSDLGLYYKQNTAAADFGGFVLGSIIPGLGGIKLLHAGQTALKAAKSGFVGENLSIATGLLVPRTEFYTQAAADTINSSVSAFKIINTKTIQALGSGLHQNVLEAAAFETVVQATMFRSPILENQDGWDIVKNIAVGGIVGGVIGGAFESAKILGTLKKSIKEEDLARLPFISRPTFAEITSPSERIILLAEDTSVGGAVPVSLTKPDGTILNNKYALDSKLYADKVRKNNNDIRIEIHKLAGSDGELANIVANSSEGLGHQTLFGNFLAAQEITRIDVLSAGDRAVQKAIKDKAPLPAYANRYVKVIGENAGEVSTTAPAVKSLGDLYVGKDAIRGFVAKQKFDLENLWDPLKNVGRSETSYLQAEARHIWAQDILKEIKPGTVIHEFDIPLLERAYKDSTLDFKVSKAGGLEYQTFQSREELYKYLKSTKEYVATKLARREVFKDNTDAISVVTNMRRSYIEGTVGTNETSDLFKMQSEAENYINGLKAKGLSTSTSEALDPKYLPKYGKFTYDTEAIPTTGTMVDSLVFFKEKQKLYEEQARLVGAKILGSDIVNSLPRITDSALITASRTGSGPGLISAENSNYGSLGSIMAWLGGKTRQAKEAQRKETQDLLEGALSRLGQKPEAALEFESINQRISRSAKQWVIHTDPEDGTRALVTKTAIKEYGEGDAIGAVKLNLADIPESDIIFPTNREVMNFIELHISRTGARTKNFQDIRAQQGHQDVKDSAVYRPIRPNLKDFSHFAFVVDDKVSSTGHMTMIHAATDKELSALIDKVPPQYRTITKQDSEDFFRARGEYDYQRSLHENFLDADLKNKGVFSNFFPKTSPQKIVDDILQQHLREDDALIYETMRLVYESKFNWLEDLGKQYAKVSTSKFASFTESLEKTIDNPYFNYIKTALDISKASEYPLLYGFNKLLDGATSKVVASYHAVFDKLKSPAELDQMNAIMDKYGMRPAFLPAYDAGMYELANHSVSKGELTKFVRGANAILGRLVLGLDPLNAVNNGIGANILRNTELTHLISAINSGNAKVAGELAAIGKVALPGTGDEILSATKLTATAIRNFFSDSGNVLLNKYKSQGFIKDRLEQFKLIVDDFTLKGTESVAILESRLKSAFDKAKDLASAGERLTGNTHVEEFNRFLSANVMDQITQIGVRNGLLSPAEALTYINTFVNRVEGNIIASQRPLIFQGPIGQAIGLFQSYQFNLLQQLFRYVAEGSKKDLAMLVGLQSTLYGVQSLPAFQFINTHIVGQLSGNKDHKDLYDQTYGAAGRQAGDFLLYGLPSNMLHANIYSRGDINPRQITVIPTTLQEIPIVAGWGKFFASVRDTVGKIGLGGNVWESMLQGIEHNGISRPLAGLAQVMQATTPSGQVLSTSSKGSILGSNDIMHWASLVRLAGGRPIDEAITNDALFRVRSYEAGRRASLQDLSEAVKSTMIAGNEATTVQVNKFADKYVMLGGKQAGFNQWMMDLYKNANVSQAAQLQGALKNPYAYKMQLLMDPNHEAD
jgi:hypothetical protein